MDPRPKPITPSAPLKLEPVTLGPEIRNPHPNDNFLIFTSLLELVLNVVVSFEKNPLWWEEKVLECRARNTDPGRAEHFTQTRSLPVSAMRKRRCGGEPIRRSAKYWPEPVNAPDISGDFTACPACRAEMRFVSAARSSAGEEGGVFCINGSFKYSLELHEWKKKRKKQREIERGDVILEEGREENEC
ncbi:hypothetical protein Lal_00025552 [Lupinus albus]|nr:hypothetical protein Lal_00025552 [Lupinus albus]